MTFVDDQARAWTEIRELFLSSHFLDTPPETANGPGCTVESTAALREWLPKMLGKYKVASMLDVGCGDWNWMRHVDFNGTLYTGWDVEPDMIEQNRQRHPGIDFQCVNLNTVDKLPEVDLIFCRQVLIHLPNELSMAALAKFRASARYLLVSHWPGADNDAAWEPGWFAWPGYMERPLDMQAAPFSMGEKLDYIEEPPGPYGVLRDGHELALFSLCAHTSQYRIHRADGTVQTVCTKCQSVIDTNPEPEGGFSLRGALDRWQQELTGSSEGNFRDQVLGKFKSEGQIEPGCDQ